jgi:lycopene beta-cyclase
VESGTGVRVEADRPVFDPATATLFDPLDERSFAYLLPLSPTEALLESASFGPVAVREDETALLRYLRTRHPDVGFTVTHAESGSIPLERVMNLGENRIEMRIARSAWFPPDFPFPYS